MSALLTERVPPGSLGSERVRDRFIQESDEICLGLKLSSLSEASKALKNEAASLEEKIKNDKVYWDALWEMREQGWSLFPCQSTDCAVGIDYGFSKVGSHFPNRGTCLIGRGEDGRPSVKKNEIPLDDAKYLRVQIKSENGELLGQTFLDNVSSDDSIDSQLRNMRSQLFDEELMAEVLHNVVF